MRAVAVVGGVGLLGAICWLVMAIANASVMPSYLAAWLFWMAMPLGALPIVLALEGVGMLDWGLLVLLRRVLLLLPAGALFVIPVLLRTAPLYRRADMTDKLPVAWMAPGWFAIRTCVILLLLSLLALVFSRTPRSPRRATAGIGLLLHVCLVSVAAVDWVMSLQPGLGSSAFGMLLILSQVSIAGCLAAFVTAVGTSPRGVLPGGLGALLAVLLGGWATLHFMQYLVVWSANLPKEITWYQARMPGAGIFSVWFAVAACVIGLAVLPTALARVPAVLASLAAMLLLVHLVETLWLVTPAFRGSFVVTWADAFAVLGIGGLLLALLGILPKGGRHAVA